MTKLEPASAMMAMIAEDACSMEGIGGDNPCCGYGSWIRARRWSPVVAAADAVANSETEMPPLLCSGAPLEFCCIDPVRSESSSREKGALSIGEIQ